MHQIPQNIRILRHEKGWSQGDFASQLGISVPAFSKIELGVTDITLSRLQQMAHILGMSANQLISYGENTQKEENLALHTADQTIKSQLTQILDLQKQVIVLHEEIRSLNKVLIAKALK